MTGMWLVVARAAEAHPGHGLDGGSYAVGHYVSEPLHLGAVAMTLALGAAVVAWRWREGRRPRRLGPGRRPDSL